MGGGEGEVKWVVVAGLKRGVVEGRLILSIGKELLGEEGHMQSKGRKDSHSHKYDVCTFTSQLLIGFV